MNTKGISYLALVLCLLAGVWMAWPNKGENGGDRSPDGKPNTISGPGVKPSSKGGASIKGSGNEEIKSYPTHEQIEFILADESITIDDAAVMLRKMADDPSLPVSDRLDALEHGLNLGFDAFANYGENPDLPTPLASYYLGEVMNQNATPKKQILAYLALLNHKDPEVVEESADMLAFMVEDDFDEANPEELLKLVRQKLTELTDSSDTDSP